MKKDWIKKFCTICGKEFKTPQYQIKRKTCSRECQYKQVSISAKNSNNSGHFSVGKIPWNKDLTKENNDQLKFISEKTSKQLKREYENGVRNRYEITKNANEKFRELTKNNPHWLCNYIDHDKVSEQSKKNCQKMKSEGRLGFQNYNTQLKARKSSAKCSRGGSYIEIKMSEILNELNIKYIEQFKIIHPKLNNCYFVDFIIPEKRIVIECDSEYWHQNIEKDKYRQSIIEYYGYNVLRFSGSDIINNIEKIKYELLNPR